MTRLQDYPYLARIDLLDMAEMADHGLLPEEREACAFCKGTVWRGSSQPEGAYWRGFASLEDATHFRVMGHVRHQLVDNSDGSSGLSSMLSTRQKRGRNARAD